MRFVFANNFFYHRGGSEKVFFDEIELLTRNGHLVAPFSRRFDSNLPSAYEEHFPSPMEYEDVSPIRKISAMFKLIYSLESKRKFSGLISTFRPHIVHAHNIYGRLTSAIVDAARARNVPVLMTLHDYKLICPSYIMLASGLPCEKCKGNRFYRCALSRCHKGSLGASIAYTAESYFNRLFHKYDWVGHFICPSRFLRNKLLEAGFDGKRLAHVPNFLDTKDFKPGLQPGSFVLFVGRLSREKGVLTLLNAARGLDIPVKVVGDGPLKGYYETYASEYGITNVSFEGHRSGRELAELYRDCAFLVFPSEWYENAPLTVLEAFAHGKPVIGSSMGGIPEMISPGENGFLFSPRDHEDLREKILFLMSSPSLLARMGKASRKKVEEEYNEEGHYRKLMELYSLYS